MAPGFNRDHDDAKCAGLINLPDGTEVLPALAKLVVPLSTVHILWKREFPYLRVKYLGQEGKILAYFFKIRNNMRHLVNKKTKMEQQLNSHSQVVEEGGGANK